MKALRWIALGGVLAFLAFCVTWRLDGGRWEYVETPSMGKVAPVGSLLWITPTDFDRLKVGDFITFHPPGNDEVTYSHRVHQVHDDGTITTKGVISAPDPWPLHKTEVVGQVRMNWWGVGWLVVAGPVLIVGFLLVGLVRSFVRRQWKLPVTLVLGSIALSVAIVIYQPFVNARQLAFAATPGGGADATYVGTGLLPIRLKANQGPSVVLSDGEVGTVHVSKADKEHRLRVELTPAFPFWWWIVLVLACFSPAVCSLVIGTRRRVQPSSVGTPQKSA